MDIDTIAGLRSPNGSLLSLYVRQGPGLSARVADLLKPIRQAVETADRAVYLSVREDSRLIGELTDRMGRDPAAGFAVFAAHGDGLFEVVPLATLETDSASLGFRPNLRPLRTMRSPLHGVAVVWERSHADLYEWREGEMVPLGGVESDLGKSNFGGFKGFEEHRVRRHSEEEIARMLSAVNDRLLQLHQSGNLDFLLAASHQPDLEMLSPHLHDYLQRLPRVTVVVDPHTLTEAQLTAHLREAESEVYRRHDLELATAVLEAEHGPIPGALGVAAVLAATNVKAVDHLVVCGDYAKPGVECLECGWLGRSGVCGVCRNSTVEIDDIVGRMIEAVIEAGGEVSSVGVATRLDAHGCGALLRFAS